MIPEQTLAEAAELYSRRSIDYRDSYKTFGTFVKALFPNGLVLNTEEDFNRWGTLSMILAKIHRYTLNFDKGHEDSLRDIIVYSAMLQELDGEMKCR